MFHIRFVLKPTGTAVSPIVETLTMEDVLQRAEQILQSCGHRVMRVTCLSSVEDGVNTLRCETNYDFRRCDSLKVVERGSNCCAVAAMRGPVCLLCAFEWTGSNDLKQWQVFNKLGDLWRATASACSEKQELSPTSLEGTMLSLQVGRQRCSRTRAGKGGSFLESI